ncbi:MAG: MprA protease, GlyGly-CTERM protein-sorting domain-containing form [Rhodospirillales bacterium]|nr:MprA protease, GlyGly-CTERM protein-sorting domain-containing form [Rhodospirillales bacterium]
MSGWAIQLWSGDLLLVSGGLRFKWRRRGDSNPRRA